MMDDGSKNWNRTNNLKIPKKEWSDGWRDGWSDGWINDGAQQSID